MPLSISRDGAIVSRRCHSNVDKQMPMQCRNARTCVRACVFLYKIEDVDYRSVEITSAFAHLPQKGEYL